MRTLTIDRIEGIYAICTDENRRFFAIPNTELPKDAAAGDGLLVDDETGTVTLAKKKQKAEK